MYVRFFLFFFFYLEWFPVCLLRARLPCFSIATVEEIHFLFDFFCGSPECVHLSARGEHGRRFRKDATSRGGGFFRCRFPGGLAGEQDEEKVSGLEKETAAREAVRDPEEAGFGLNGNVKFVTWANECNRAGSLPNLSVLKEEEF